MTHPWKCTLASGLVLMAVHLMAQEPKVVTDPEAYAIYGMLLPRAWATVSKDPILLQRETERPTHSCADPKAPYNEWQSVIDNFHRENARVQLLQPLSLRASHRLIARAEIETDDARLALKYPGAYQRRPESMEYAAVSAVGFNPDKTKAIVYVRLRSSGDLRFMEKRDGEWVPASGVSICGWMA